MKNVLLVMLCTSMYAVENNVAHSSPDLDNIGMIYPKKIFSTQQARYSGNLFNNDHQLAEPTVVQVEQTHKKARKKSSNTSLSPHSQSDIYPKQILSADQARALAEQLAHVSKPEPVKRKMSFKERWKALVGTKAQLTIQIPSEQVQAAGKTFSGSLSSAGSCPQAPISHGVFEFPSPTF